MLIRKEVGYLLLVVIAIASIGASIGGAWLYVNLTPMLEDRAIKAEMLRLHAASRLYYSKLETFQGVCKDIGLRPGYECNEARETFAVSVERPDGTFYCIDRADDVHEQILPIRTYTKCIRGGQEGQ